LQPSSATVDVACKGAGVSISSGTDGHGQAMAGGCHCTEQPTPQPLLHCAHSWAHQEWIAHRLARSSCGGSRCRRQTQRAWRWSTLRVLASPRAAPAALMGSGIGRAEHRVLPHRQPRCPPPSLLCCAGNFVLVGCLPVTAAAHHSLPEFRSQGNLLLGSRDRSRLGQHPSL
jgi:hypothetical protein